MKLKEIISIVKFRVVILDRDEKEIVPITYSSSEKNVVAMYHNHGRMGEDIVIEITQKNPKELLIENLKSELAAKESILINARIEFNRIKNQLQKLENSL